MALSPFLFSTLLPGFVAKMEHFWLCTLMSNLSEAEIGFKVIRGHRLLCGCINLIFLGDRAKPHKSFTSSHQELLSKALRRFTLHDPKSLSIISIDIDVCLLELLICSDEPEPCASLGDADVMG